MEETIREGKMETTRKANRRINEEEIQKNSKKQKKEVEEQKKMRNGRR